MTRRHHNISIHALAKRATIKSRLDIRKLTLFQSTPSQRGRLVKHIKSRLDTRFQSTPSQRGRHYYVGDGVFTMWISIHALAKRATRDFDDYKYRVNISIHALAKRATFCQNMAIQHAIDFNPRPRKEGDSKFIQ